MANSRLTTQDAAQAIKALKAAGGVAARRLKILINTFKSRIDAAVGRFGFEQPEPSKIERVKLIEPATPAHLRKIAQLEQTVKDLRGQLGEMTKEQVSVHALREIIHGSADVPANPLAWRFKQASGHTTGIPLLFVSDLHWDEMVDPAQIGGVNAYNHRIAVDRLKHCFGTFIDLTTNHLSKPSYDYAVLALGGDCLSGIIHDELRETNEFPIHVSVLSLADHLIAGITAMHNAFGRVYIPAVVGNHGRIDKKPRAKNRVFDNYDWLVYQLLAKHFKGEKDITFEIPEGSDVQFALHNTRYLLTHGDQFKGGSGIAGALSPLLLGFARKRKRQMAVMRPYDFMMMGHWHQYLMARGIICNGSGKGYDEYAAHLNFDFEVPTQAAWLTHPDWGITARWPIFLEPPGKIFRSASILERAA
ncbi:MAG: hypothetical protein OJF52_001822 [Nitrospira sp.]|jgi:hypothetical protein|nr:MAG: hypothetical protein OJF52_001822 [Nitrospira sp.]